VKRVKLNLVRSQYENLIMNESECMDDMITHFTKITNGLSSLGDLLTMTKK